MVRVLVTLGFLLASLSPTAGQGKRDKNAPAPKLLCAVPLAARPGEKQKLTIRGKGLVAIKEVKVSGVEGAKVKVLGSKSIGAPNNAPAEKLGDSEVEIELELPKDAKPGAVKLMASGSNGESNAYTLLLRDSLTAVAEKEPNDGFEQAQAISIPCAIEGIIKNDRDVDVYKFKGKKGDKVRIELQAVRFGSPLDPIVTVYDSNRGIVDSANSTTRMPDPTLIVNLPKDGAYLISVIDANDLGGPQFGYRLVVRKE